MPAPRTGREQHGRKYGWAVFRDGTFVGQLVEPVWEDMFWHSYRIIGPRNPPLDPRFDITDFWRASRGLTYVNLVLGVAAPHAFPGGDPPRDGRVWMRGLCVCEEESLLSRLADWFCEWW